jgi:hypothetical protein
VSGYLFAGLRGTLTLHEEFRARWEEGSLEPDAFSLIASWSSILDFADFTGADDASVQWSHCDAGGDWTQDGEERLIAWLQADVGAGRHLPLQSCFNVLERAVTRVGEVSVHELQAIVPLASGSVPAGRLAEQRDWLALGAAPGRVLAGVDIGGRAADEVLATFAELADGKAERVEYGGDRGFAGRTMPADALWLECQVRGEWSVELGAWVIGLLAHACRGAGDDMLVVVARDL